MNLAGYPLQLRAARDPVTSKPSIQLLFQLKITVILHPISNSRFVPHTWPCLHECAIAWWWFPSHKSTQYLSTTCLSGLKPLSPTPCDDIGIRFVTTHSYGLWTLWVMTQGQPESWSMLNLWDIEVQSLNLLTSLRETASFSIQISSYTATYHQLTFC